VILILLHIFGVTGTLNTYIRLNKNVSVVARRFCSVIIDFVVGEMVSGSRGAEVCWRPTTFSLERLVSTTPNSATTLDAAYVIFFSKFTCRCLHTKLCPFHKSELGTYSFGIAKQVRNLCAI
jgi:hypothetical protein